jgi:hypothetical protein
MRLLAVTDSLGMPRQGVDYEDTWIYKVEHQLTQISLIDRSKRARTTVDLQHADMLERYNPDIVVTQLGIVDCAPRTFYKYEKYALRIIPDKFSKLYVTVSKTLRKREPNKSYTKLNIFEANLRNYYERAEKCDVQVVSIKILPASSAFVQKSHDITEQISKYNFVYDRLAAQYKNVDLLAPFDFVEDIDDLFVDREHPNQSGNSLIYQKLSSKLIDFIHYD